MDPVISSHEAAVSQNNCWFLRMKVPFFLYPDAIVRLWTTKNNQRICQTLILIDWYIISLSVW